MGSSSSSSSNGSSNNSYDTEENKRRLMRITIVKLKEIILNHNASLPPESKRKKVPLSGLCKDDLIDKLLKLDWAASPTTEEIIKSMLDPLPSSSTKGKKTKPAPKYKTPLAENSNCPEPEPETVLKPKPPPPPPPPPPPLTTPTTNHQLKTGKNFTKAWISETSHSLGWVQKSPPFSLHLPPQFFVENRVTVPIPWGLSPSSSSEFNACPQSYLFRYLLKVPALPGLALQRGTLIHEVLEKIFDQDWGSERSNEDEIKNWAVDEFRRLWGKEREKSQIVYDELFQDDDSGSGSGSVSGGGNVNVNGNGNGNGNSDDNDNNNHKSHLSRTQKQLKMESEWGAESLKILSNYFEMEQEEIFFDEPPIAREMWVNETADLGKKKGEGAKVRGIVDRIDLVNDNKTTGSSKKYIRITDYKTGKAPNIRQYSADTTERIVREKFAQLKIYAILLRNMQIDDKLKNSPVNKNWDVRYLRLMYLTSNNGEGETLDMDLGKTNEEREGELQPVVDELNSTWKNILKLTKQANEEQHFQMFNHCKRSFCDCHKLRDRFVDSKSLFKHLE